MESGGKARARGAGERADGKRWKRGAKTGAIARIYRRKTGTAGAIRAFLWCTVKAGKRKQRRNSHEKTHAFPHPQPGAGGDVPAAGAGAGGRIRHRAGRRTEPAGKGGPERQGAGPVLDGHLGGDRGKGRGMVQGEGGRQGRLHDEQVPQGRGSGQKNVRAHQHRHRPEPAQGPRHQYRYHHVFPHRHGSDRAGKGQGLV